MNSLECWSMCSLFSAWSVDPRSIMSDGAVVRCDLSRENDDASEAHSDVNGSTTEVFFWQNLYVGYSSQFTKNWILLQQIKLEYNLIC